MKKSKLINLDQEIISALNLIAEKNGTKCKLMIEKIVIDYVTKKTGLRSTRLKK